MRTIGRGLSTDLDLVGMSESDTRSCRKRISRRPWEVLMRKATAFWLEGSPRATVRFVEHDTVPTGPPIKVPPHNLKGEAAEWVDAKLQEEVARGHLERGSSP